MPEGREREARPPRMRGSMPREAGVVEGRIVRKIVRNIVHRRTGQAAAVGRRPPGLPLVRARVVCQLPDLQPRSCACASCSILGPAPRRVQWRGNSPDQRNASDRFRIPGDVRQRTCDIGGWMASVRVEQPAGQEPPAGTSPRTVLHEVRQGVAFGTARLHLVHATTVGEPQRKPPRGGGEAVTETVSLGRALVGLRPDHVFADERVVHDDGRHSPSSEHL